MNRNQTLEPTGRSRFRANGWPVVPMRVFLAALFLFAGYAKFSYPGFFDPGSPTGLKASIDSVRHGTPIGSALGPLSEHPSVYGHIIAIAEIAIGLGLLVGLLTRLAALGGMVLTGLIALSINWDGVKQYTGSSGWFTSVDLAVAAALSVYLLGGAGPLSLDGLLVRARARRRARDDAEPGFVDDDLEGSRRRLQGEPTSQRLPVADQAVTEPESGWSRQVVEEDDDPYSLWNSGPREPEPEPDGPQRR
ncbi:MAG TPA: DoxX family protein [Jatrophihabitans sp.]|nr:DoxX family protein [Jatrophihabitans sp.]